MSLLLLYPGAPALTLPALTWASGGTFPPSVSGASVGVVSRTAGSTLSVPVGGTFENLFPDSADFTLWSQSGVAITANAVMAPNGTMTADTVDITGAGSNWVQKALTGMTAGQTYTLSWYVKRGTAGDLTYGIFNDFGGAFIVSPTSYYAETHATDWKRIVKIFTAGSGGQTMMLLRDGPALGTFHLWGAQLLVGSHADGGPYVATSGAPASQTFTANFAINNTTAEVTTTQALATGNYNVEVTEAHASYANSPRTTTLVATATNAVSVVPQTGVQSHTATSPSLTPVLAVASASHGHTATSPTIAAKSVIAADNAAQAQTATSPTIAAKSAITPANADQSQTATSPTVAAKSVVAADSATQAHSATSPTVAAKSTIAADSASQAHTATSPTVAAKSTVAADSATQGHSATSPTLAVTSAVTPASATHTQTATSPTVVAAVTTPDNASHGHTATSPTLAPASTVAPANASHDHTATSPSIGAQSIIAAANAAHGHAATSPSVGNFVEVLANSAVHAHSATSPTLGAKSVVAPDSALHGHVASRSFVGSRTRNVRVSTVFIRN